MYVRKIITYIASKTFIFFHEAFIFLVDLKNLANAVGSCLSLNY